MSSSSEVVADKVRYIPGDSDNNRIVRLALLDAWGDLCYMCGEPKSFKDVQIDHLIAQDLVAVSLAEKLAESGTKEVQELDFDVHAPHNLGPVCVPCNVLKSNTDFTASVKFVGLLDKARKLESVVTKHVRAWRKSDKVTKAMLAVSVADLSDEAAREALLSLGPIVVNRLRRVAPEALKQPYFYSFDDHLNERFPGILMVMDESSRRARIVLEDVFGYEFDDTVIALVDDLRREISSAIEEVFEADMSSQLRDHGHEYFLIENIEDSIRVELRELSFDAESSVFGVRGRFDAAGTAHVDLTVGNDGGFDTEQVDADPVRGAFSAEFTLGSDVSDVKVVDYEIEVDE